MYITNYKDIQVIWKDPDNTKRRQGIKDIAGALIDPCYYNMKDGFGHKEHGMWSDAPLPRAHMEYAAKDAYVSYELYRRLDLFQRGYYSLNKNQEEMKDKTRARNYWQGDEW